MQISAYLDIVKEFHVLAFRCCLWPVFRCRGGDQKAVAAQADVRHHDHGPLAAGGLRSCVSVAAGKGGRRGEKGAAGRCPGQEGPGASRRKAGGRAGTFPRAGPRPEEDARAGQEFPGWCGQPAGGRCAADLCRRQRRGHGSLSGGPVRRHGASCGHAARTRHLAGKDVCPPPCGQGDGCACARHRDSSRARGCRTGGLTGSGAFCWPVCGGSGGSCAGRGTASRCREAGSCFP